jgi:SPW repeat
VPYAAQARTASGINILLGIWLLVSPWVSHYSAIGLAATASSVIVGAFIAVLAATRLASWRDTAPFSGVNLILALCTIASPWVYGYAANVGGVRDNVIVGVVIAALAIWSGGVSIAQAKHPPGATSP